MTDENKGVAADLSFGENVIDSNQNDEDYPVDAMLILAITALNWIGFEKVDYQESTEDEVFQIFMDLKELTEKGIHGLSTYFSAHAKDNSRMIFCLRTAKTLLALAHWAQDFDRAPMDPCVDSLDKESFLIQLIIVPERSVSRELLATQSDVKSKYLISIERLGSQV